VVWLDVNCIMVMNVAIPHASLSLFSFFFFKYRKGYYNQNNS